MVLSLDLATTPGRLFDAITTAQGLAGSQGLAGWYTPHATAEPLHGACVELGFGPGTTLTFQVDELEPRRRVVWSGVRVPRDRKPTRIAFAIVPVGALANRRSARPASRRAMKRSGASPPAAPAGCWPRRVRWIRCSAGAPLVSLAASAPGQATVGPGEPQR
jgi:hypothetical protein